MPTDSNSMMQMQGNEIVLYQPNDAIHLEVRLAEESVWLTQQQIATLFGVQQPAISKHLSNIFKSGELDEDSVYSILEYTAADGKLYKTKFYNLEGQIYDAYELVCRLVKSAKSRIVLIDNHIDESVLTLFDKRNDDVTATIYTQQISHQLQLDIQRHDSQYAPIPVHTLTMAHDRFLLIDDDVYHIGASIKDLGKRWFAIMKMQETKAEEILRRL